MTYFVRNVVPGNRGLRGATAELAWRLEPVSRLRLHRPICFLPHRQPVRTSHRITQQDRSVTANCNVIELGPAALRLPDNDCCAIRPPEALRAARPKTSMFMLEIQNQKRKTDR